MILINNYNIKRVKFVFEKNTSVMLSEEEASCLLMFYSNSCNDKLPLTDRELWNDFMKFDLSNYIGWKSYDLKYIND